MRNGPEFQRFICSRIAGGTQAEQCSRQSEYATSIHDISACASERPSRRESGVFVAPYFIEKFWPLIGIKEQHALARLALLQCAALPQIVRIERLEVASRSPLTICSNTAQCWWPH